MPTIGPVTRCLFLLLGLAAGGCSDHLGVSEVHARSAELVGQRIRVRGWTMFVRRTTLVLCECCNELIGQLELTSERWTSQTVPATERLPSALPSCTGRACVGLTCSPFDPTSAPGFELVGVLTRVAGVLPPWDLRLEDIDLTASRRLVGSSDDLSSLAEEPIPTGEFTIP